MHNDEEEISKIIRIILSIILLIICIFIPSTNIKNVIFLINYIIISYDIILEAIKNIAKAHLIDETFLMTIATLGAIIIGEYQEAIIVMTLYQIGELLQETAVNKSKKHIKELMNIKPDFARIKINNKYKEVPPKDVSIGDIILVKPGEKIPLDGTIIKGTSYLDTFSLTGESIPKNVKENDKVLSGSINQNRVLEIKVTCNEEESTVNKILKLIENATDKQANHEKFITKFAKIYTPIVIILAILLTTIPPIILKQPINKWLYRALSFLVISCPCALVISIPLAFFAGIGICAKHGILIKGSYFLESIPKIKNIVFDKTGTLTKGVFDIQEINAINNNKEELLETVAYAEYYSNHPIAISIKKHYHKEINKNKIEQLEELSGYGIKVLINKKEVLVGNEKLMKKYKINYQKNNQIGTILYIAIEKKFQGTILISDKIKDNIENTIATLKNNYNIKSIMLTGDKKEYAEDIKNKIKIEEYYAEMLPQEKVKHIEKLSSTNKNELTAFIGDGINDAPALALANIGISMGGTGSDAAIEAADIIFMDDKIEKIITLINISNKTLKIAKQNIILAISIKIIILLLSATGLTSMWLAIFSDVGVSIIAILNSLRLLKVNIK